MPPNDDLDTRLRAAHESGDRSILIGLYCEAAEMSSDAEATGFYLTHAYVFALESGDPRAADLKKQLVSMGRDVTR
ncbi:MAG: hypothetical protein AAF340_07335 [Pseudomonadota bacterium]